MRALIIDDSEDDAHVIETSLRESFLDENLETMHASNLREALKLLERGIEFSVVFVDLSLARGTDPRDIVRVLEQHGVEPSAVIFSTQNPSGKQAEAARRAAAKVITKGAGDRNPSLLQNLVLDIQRHQRDRSIQYRQEFARVEGKLADLYHGLSGLLKGLEGHQQRLERLERTLYGNDTDGLATQFRDLQRADALQEEEIDELKGRVKQLEGGKQKLLSDFLVENAKGFWAVTGAIAAGLLTWFLASR